MSPIFPTKVNWLPSRPASSITRISGAASLRDNHDVFEEGLFIPLVKLYDGGVPQFVCDRDDPVERRTADEVDRRHPVPELQPIMSAPEKVCQMLKEKWPGESG